MGHSSSSFISWVGGRPSSNVGEIDEDRVTLPEKDLWVAVLTRAVLDACKGPPDLDLTRRANVSHQSHYKYNRRAARHFFTEGGSHCRLVCEMAGRNPDYVQTKVRTVILRKNGWNVDVPITSHYRQGPKRGGHKKKYRRVGRPRLYGV